MLDASLELPARYERSPLLVHSPFVMKWDKS